MAVSARIQQIYLALFGRPADPVGGEFYDTLTHDGADLTAILTGSSRLSGSAEYTSRFTGMNDTQIVETIYQSLFGHPADLAGLTFYTQAMANGEAQTAGQPLPFPGVPAYTIEQIAVGILDGATGTDAAVIANKTTAAVEFTDSLDTPAEIAAYQGQNAADFGRDFINDVTSDPASVPTQTQVDNSLNDLVNNVANGLSVNLTADVDNVTTNVADTLHTSAANDVIRGTIDSSFFGSGSTFNNGDQINGGEGYDRLELTNVTQSFGPPIPPAVIVATLNNVEELSVRNLGYQTAVELDATSWDNSLEKITLHNSFDSNQGVVVDSLKSNVEFNFQDTDGYIDVNYAPGVLGANATVAVNVSNSDAYVDAYEDTSSTDSIATLNINSTGILDNNGRNELTFDNEVSGSLTAVNVTGDSAIDVYLDDETGLATFDASGNSGGVYANLTDTGVDITITGSSNDDDITVDFDHVVTADLGAGNDDLTTYGDVSTGSSLSLGAGDDYVYFDGIVGAGASVDGGDGIDTIEVSDSANFSTADTQTAFGNAISNFEVLELDFSVDSNLSLDLAKLDNIGTVYLEGGVYNNSTLTLDNFTSGNTFELNDSIQAGSSVAINVGTDTASDVVNVVLDDAGYYDILGTLDVTGFETVNLTTNQSGTGYGAELVNLVTDATTVTVTGNEGVAFTTDLGLNLTTLDASGVTGTGTDGAVSFTSNLLNTHDLSVSTGAGDDFVTLLGTGNDTVNTGAGNDTVTALGGGDITVDAGDGNNSVTTGVGDDTITTGAGNDTIIAGDGANTVNAGDGINAVTAGAGDDIITTGAGNDSIIAGDGANTVNAGDGANIVTTGAGIDTITTGAGDDTITAGGGADTITTGAGNDVVFYNAVSDSSATSVDTITDFQSGSDTINLSAITGGVGTYNGEASSYAAAITALTGGTVASAVLDTSTHQLYVDVNGDGTIGAGDMIITLTGVNDLTNGTHNDIVF
jgi:hypothetical protein